VFDDITQNKNSVTASNLVISRSFIRIYLVYARVLHFYFYRASVRTPKAAKQSFVLSCIHPRVVHGLGWIGLG